MIARRVGGFDLQPQLRQVAHHLLRSLCFQSQRVGGALKARENLAGLIEQVFELRSGSALELGLPGSQALSEEFLGFLHLPPKLFQRSGDLPLSLRRCGFSRRARLAIDAVRQFPQERALRFGRRFRRGDLFLRAGKLRECTSHGGRHFLQESR